MILKSKKLLKFKIKFQSLISKSFADKKLFQFYNFIY